MSRMRAADRSFNQNSDGSTSLIFALCTVILFGGVGGAVDLAIYFRNKQTYTEAIDSAALAGARVKQWGGTDTEAIDTANAFLDSVKAANPTHGPITFSVVDGGTALKGTASLSVPSVFLRVLGIADMRFDVTNKAEFGTGADVEISLMLDTTGSMSGSKINDLKGAVDSLISIAIKDDKSGPRARIALVPFSNSVSLDSKHYKAVTGSTKGGGGCVVERFGSDAYTDASPGAGRYLTALEDVSKASCSGTQTIFPLSDKKADLKTMVKSLTVGGPTAGHLGTAWAWYLLSPQWASMLDSDEQPGPYEDLKKVQPSGAMKLRKIAVLMTDGEYNTSYSGVDATTQARALCVEMKKTGIEVFTVGFELTGSTTVLETLEGCASSPTHFYKADSGASLNQAFIDIALKASQLRLSN